MKALVSFAILQLGWFACVLGAARGYPAAGPIVVLAILGWHVRRMPAPARSREVLVLALSAALGFVVDTALLRAGVTVMAGATLAPLWILALWPNTAAATAPGGTLAALAHRPWLAALLGAVAGPLAYDGGVRLGALEFPPAERWRSLVILGIVWAGVLPAFAALRRRCAAPELPAPPTRP